MEGCDPIDVGYTIYSKSGCVNCRKFKQLLMDKNFFFYDINCDEYLIEKKEQFLSFISEKAQKECNTFPMIFYNGNFIGGYIEAKRNIEKTEVLFDDI